MKDKRNRTKKEEAKYLIIFAIVMLASFFGGAVVGRLIKRMQDNGTGISINIAEIKEILTPIVPFIFAGLNIIVGIFAAVLIRKASKSLKIWDGEDEDIAKKIEERLGVALAMATVLNVINFFLFALSVNLDISSKSSDEIERITTLANITIFALSLAEAIVIQKRVIDVNKLLNPEKKGSVFDFKFKTKWMDSCDEAEQMKTFKATYTAFQCTQMTCIILWILCVVGDMAFGIGLLPVAMVTIIWLVLVVSYLIAGSKLEK